MGHKTQIEFEGFENVLSKLTKMNANVKGITEKALKKTHQIVTKKAEEAIEPHHDTGATEKSLYREANVEWAGTVASVSTGFSIREGGLASIFLMYGTPRHAVSNQYGRTKGIVDKTKKDSEMYNAFWSKKTQNEIMEAQEEIFYAEIRKLDG